MTRTLDRFFFEPYPVYPLVLCRILLGLALLHVYVLRGLEYGELMGAHGLSHYLGAEHRLIPAECTPWIYGLLLAATTAFTLGFLTPIAGVAVAVCHLYFNTLEPIEWGWRNVIHAFVLYVAVSGAGRAYALDALLRRRRFGTPALTHAPAWPLRLVQFHVVAVYIAASYHRLDDYGWLHGQMVFEALTMSLWTRFPGVDFFPYRPLLEAANWWTWSLELSAPIALWITRFRIRTFIVLNLIAMHALLELTSSLGGWQPMMIATLLCFAPPSWSQRVLEVARRGLLRADPAALGPRPDRKTRDREAT